MVTDNNTLMKDITTDKIIQQNLQSMEKYAECEYEGINRHPKYPSVKLFIRCMNELFDYLLSNANLYGLNAHRIDDLIRVDNRTFELDILGKETKAMKHINNDLRFQSFQEISEDMYRKIDYIKSEFLNN